MSAVKPTINNHHCRPASAPVEQVGTLIDRPSPHSASFPRSARLLTAADYSTVFKSSKRFTDRYWTVLVHKASTPSPARLGLAIAKKRAKRATDRNRIKRIAREAFRQSGLRESSLDLVVMNRDAAASEDPRILRQSLDAILNKVSRSLR